MPDDVKAPKAIEDEPRYLTSVARGFRVLEELSVAPGPLTLSELARSTGLTVPTVQRLTATLTDAGYLEKEPDTKRYRSTVKTVDLLYSYLSRNEFAKTAWPHLVRLREELKLDVSLSVPLGSSMIYVHRLPGYRGNFENTLPGKRLPMQLSASGRCHLAAKSDQDVQSFLASSDLTPLTARSLIEPEDIFAAIEESRANGYCLVEQETSLGLATIACPVTRGMEVVAGVSVHAPIAAASRETLVERVLPTLVSVALAICSSSP
ncbi:IclR family transcriptional regulator [Aliiroseovarius subalbicans]|uniref:IclR family transcriptional regulator n=1 Tax=Aliiroseovarius subalbicans TaxID=2925840 RepID=UPI001F56F265|nr:IclR family transcriptional regulator [Aliiroseovarius subalbicans]MCI2399073.1 IclR family transcriptional regulator [Aliiroseovarius subalbicans]